MLQKNKDEILNRIDETGVKLSFLNELIGGYRGKLTEWKKGKTTLTENEMKIIINYLYDDKKFVAPSEAEEFYNRYQNLLPDQKAIIDGMFEQFEKK